MSGLWLYALVDQPLVGPGPQGVAREPVRTLEVAPGVHAAIGAVEGSVGVSEAALRAHDATVRALALVAPATLPVRFGQTAADEAALRARVLARHDELAAALAQVRGCEQMTLRLFGSPDDAPAEPPAAEETDPSLGPGARYLAARRRAHDLAPAAPPALVPLLDALAPLVRASRVERPRAPAAGGPALLASVYHLVTRGQAGAYARRVEELSPALAPRHVTLSGPWPCYAFAPSPG